MSKNVIKELKSFILRGNVLDMAIGIIIGISFNNIVNSLVKDIIMPPLGLILGKVDFANLYIQIYPLGIKYPSLEIAKEAGAVTINYGIFLNTIISFIILTCSIFILIKIINKFNSHKNIQKEIKTKKCEFCYSEIPIKATRCPFCTSKL